MNALERSWPLQPGTIPYWVYTDQSVYAEELQRIWYGPHWLYCGLEIEIPERGNFKTTTLGERPMVIVRGADGDISVLENRCSHRGVQFCRERFGKAENFTCPYHQWTYSLKGDLVGVPFRRGYKGKGGMPIEFDLAEHALPRLRAEVVNGVIWATFSQETPSFRDYLGAKMFGYYERIFSGKQLRIVGYNRHLIPSNWKLMLENIKDPYHAALLHVFFATFGLFRPDQKSALEMDDTGRHCCLMSIMPSNGGGHSEVSDSLPAFNGSFQLADKRIIEYVKELKGEETVGSNTIFPSVILLQQVNSLQTRQIIPRGPGKFEFVWTHFGYEDDDAEMRLRRTRSANLFGPAGYVSADDNEVLAMAQNGFTPAPEDIPMLIMMGGYDVKSEDTQATEGAIRGMYQYYRKVMEL